MASLSARLDQALADMASASKAAVKSALTGLAGDLSSVQVGYDSPAAEQIWVEDRLIDLARDLAAQMR
jgi:hypothetical protein